MTKCGKCGKKASTIPCNRCEKRICKRCRTPFNQGYSGVTSAVCTDKNDCDNERRERLIAKGVRVGA